MDVNFNRFIADGGIYSISIQVFSLSSLLSLIYCCQVKVKYLFVIYAPCTIFHLDRIILDQAVSTNVLLEKQRDRDSIPGT